MSGHLVCKGKQVSGTAQGGRRPTGAVPAERRPMGLPEVRVRGKRICRLVRVVESEVQRFIQDNGGGA